MIRILIGISGSGKTHKIKTELIQPAIKRKRFVIERDDNPEYSQIFNKDFITTFKLKEISDQLPILMNIKNADIYIDCPYYSKEILDNLGELVRHARIQENNITITFMDPYDLYEYENFFLRNADEVLIGKCCVNNKELIEKMFHRNLPVLKRKYDFRKII